MKKYFSYFPLLFPLTLMAMALQFSSCAVMVPPTGGPKDSLPPHLSAATPVDSALNFDSKEIMLTFDEYVTVDNPTENVLVSPYPKKNPVVTSHLQHIRVQLKDTLQPNTTYSINFGRAVKDVNEGNVFKNFTYVFSTGNHLDTDSITGSVALAETGKTDSTLIVMLHRNLSDTAIRKLPPDYLARLDSAGHFAFRFLPVGDYNIFVLQNDYAKRYTDSTQLFGFYNQVLHITDSTAPDKLKLYAYQEVKPKEEKKGNQEENYSKKKKDKIPALKLSTSLSNDKQDLLHPLHFSFDRTLDTLDITKIALYDTNYVHLSDYSITRDDKDTAHKNFLLTKAWKEDQRFILVLDSNVAIDTFGISLGKMDTVRFTTQKEADYASIRLSFPDVDMSLHPVLQFLQSDAIVDSIPIASNKTVIRKLFPAGDFELRILYDSNQNGHWDAGNYSQKTQPEIVEYIKKKFTFKPNWDNEPEIYLHGTGK